MENKQLEIAKEIIAKMKASVKQRDPERMAHVMESLWDLWEELPDLRLGQLVYCITAKTDLFTIEDDKFLKLLETWKAEHVT